MNISYTFADEPASQKLARKLATCLVKGLVLTFSGEIGTGKTSFIRALLRALGETGAVKSPSFSLVETYLCQDFRFHHFDLYRIHEVEELGYIGFRDYFVSTAICCIEWPERLPKRLIDVDLRFVLSIEGSERLMSIEALSLAGEKIVDCLEGKV